jgi:hypothetical protein
MKIRLLKTFGATGFRFKIKKGEVIATDGNKNVLKEGVDYVVEEKSKAKSVQIVQASGLTSYLATE